MLNRKLITFNSRTNHSLIVVLHIAIHLLVRLTRYITINRSKTTLFVIIDSFESIYFAYICCIKYKYIDVKPYSDRKNY